MHHIIRLSSSFVLSILLVVLAAAPGTSAPPGALPCAAEAQAAVAAIRTLVSVAGLSGGNENALLAKLDAADKSIDKDNANAASGQLGALRNQVEAFAANGTLSADDAQAILDAIDGALAVLESCSGTARLAFFNVSSGDGKNGLFWVNPAAPYASTRVLFRTDTYPTGVSDPLATVLGTIPGTAGAVGSTPHTGLDNGTTYYYAAFAEDGASVPSAARTSRGRPDDTSGIFRWAYTIGRPRSIAGVSVAPAYHALSDDALHATRKSDGGWPASWKPAAIPAPSPLTRPVTIGITIGAATRVTFVSSRTGVLFAVNADTGELLWTSPPLGGQVVSAPSGVFPPFAPTSYIFVGVQTPNGGGRFHALNAVDGTIRWSFDDDGNLGPVVTQPSVVFSTSRIYFTSKARGAADTVWCLGYAPMSFTNVWSANPGDVNTSPAVREGSVYVGTMAGDIHSLDADDGAVLWPTPHATGDGPVFLFVFRPISTNRLYFSTANAAHALTDTGAAAVPFWTAPLALPNPSVPIPVAPNVYISAADGRIYQVSDTTTTPSPIAVSIGDPSAPSPLGQLTFDISTATVTVGSAAGVVYALKFPFAP